MRFNRFIPTSIFHLGANIYIADMLYDIIKMVAENQEESLVTCLLTVNNSGHCYIDQYVDTPLTDVKLDEDEDRLYIKMINTIENALIKMVNDNYCLFDLLTEYIKNNKYVDIKGLTEGVNVYYGEKCDFDPHSQGPKTFYTDFN